MQTDLNCNIWSFGLSLCFTCWVLQWQQPVRNSSHSRPSPPQRPASPEPEPEPEPQVSTVTARSNFQTEENIFNSKLIGFHSAGEPSHTTSIVFKDTTLNFWSFNSSVTGSKMLLNVETPDWREQHSVCRCLLAELSQIKFLLQYFGKENTIFYVSSSFRLQNECDEIRLLTCCYVLTGPWLCVDWGCAAADSLSLLHVQFHRLWDCRAPARKMSPGSTGQTSDCLQETLRHTWRVYRCRITDIITYIYLVFL